MIINEENLQILKAIMGKTGDNKFQPLRLDISTHTLPIIDYAHHTFLLIGMNTPKGRRND
jgi:hypothetical protein